MNLRIINFISILILSGFQFSEEVLLFSQFESCDDPLIKFKANFKTINDRYQLFNGSYIAPIPNGENLRAKFLAKVQVGSVWAPLFMLDEEKGMCALLEKYIGPVFNELLRAAALMPTCPIPKGTHMWRNYKPSMEQMRLQLPNGKLKINLKGIEKSSGKLAFCLDAMVTNK